MDIVPLLVVGLVAGLLASVVMRGAGYGVIADILLGIAGAVVGSWGFREAGWHAPFIGMAGVIFVAFCGAIVLLVALRLVRAASMRRAHA